MPATSPADVSPRRRRAQHWRHVRAVCPLVERAGGTVIATVEICDRLEAVVDPGVPNYALAEYEAPETTRSRNARCAVPATDHDVLSILPWRKPRWHRRSNACTTITTARTRPRTR